jgi:N4-gp56 family major capsid protein
MALEYGSPVIDTTDSGIGPQIRTDYFHKRALIEAAKESYFGQLASVIGMPKNMGKKIKRFHYLPILDDRNTNDQGLDAVGAAPSAGVVGTVNTHPYVAYVSILATGQPVSQTKYFRGDNLTGDAEALAEAKGKLLAWAYGEGYNTTQDIDATATAADIAAAYVELVAAAFGTTDYAVTVVAATATTPYGNLYGSSKDIGTIQSKIPALSETGGRVNRVGMKRIELEGTIEKFGFFDEYTQDSLDFDSDAELLSHITMESVKGANEITEDQLQIDLINGAGVIRFAGSATSIATLQGDDVAAPFDAGNTNDFVSYDDLVKLGVELDDNRTPIKTTIIAGSRMIDTKVINAARYMYIGSELKTVIMRMIDYHGNKAFIPVAQYADAGNVARGEFGAIDNFRFIVVPEMMHREAAGAEISATAEDDTTRTSFRFSASADGATLNYNAYPMLVVGDGSFNTIGFQTDGKTVKFKIYHKKPGETVRPEDPYGETGFYSIKWFYGTMILRPERLAVLWTCAEW